MAGSEQGVRYATSCLKYMKKCFEQIHIWSNNDNGMNDYEIGRMAIDCAGKVQMALDDLRMFGDKITVHMENGKISIVEGLPPGWELAIKEPGKELTLWNHG